MTTVSEAIRNNWMHISSFDSAIPRENKRETISGVLKDMNRIKDEVHTLHLRFSDMEQGKLDIVSAQNLETQFEKLKQQLQLHTLLIAELRKYHSEIDELKSKDHKHTQEEHKLRLEIRKLKNDLLILTETVSSHNMTSRIIPDITTKVESLQTEYIKFKSQIHTSERNKVDIEALRREVEKLSLTTKRYDEQTFSLHKLREEVGMIQNVIHQDIPQLKSEIQRKMNKTIQVTNELKESVDELSDKVRIINEEKKQDRNLISQLVNQAEQLRLQVHSIRISQKDSSNKIRQEELVNQCVHNIAKLAESVNSLQEKISTHLIALSSARSTSGSIHNEYKKSAIQSKVNSLPNTPYDSKISQIKLKEQYKQNEAVTSSHYFNGIKEKRDPNISYYLLPETPSTQAPAASHSSHLDSCFFNDLNFNDSNNSRPTTNNTIDTDYNNISSSIVTSSSVELAICDGKQFLQIDNEKDGNTVTTNYTTSEDNNCNSSGENSNNGNECTSTVCTPKKYKIMKNNLQDFFNLY
ncbi:hypothetical protein cand_014660 [Cryptosporidium andersoni]|uniref:Uncharacterized protein n=1 Tax=Cryptosporidium andersoni TaxID=117008 RepID=A0A1J4MTT1_9CRYT|nr:hypothetical protein cand_014660 [Cryptosporidium andersoni]